MTGPGTGGYLVFGVIRVPQKSMGLCNRTMELIPFGRPLLNGRKTLLPHSESLTTEKKKNWVPVGRTATGSVRILDPEV